MDAIYSKTKARRVLDLYGPTETTTYSTWAARESGAPATIGRPLTNQQIYLLDANRQPVPIGIPGEVYIGGSGVARGYLNRPELTAEKFVQSPFSEGERLYRTGDLARWRKDGNLEYLGRIDHQVKIRGFRIELGEIEAALRSHPAVSSAVVIARESGDAGKSLVAYAGLNNGKTATAAELQALLESRLPGYMVPPVIMVLEALPLTPNGKIDRKALPSPETVREVTAGIVEPRTETESRLCEIWKAVLASGRVGVTDNFFDLGGHSLLAIRIVSHARESMGIELPLFAIFDDPTVEALARKIDQGKWSSTAHQDSLVTRVSRESALQASFVQERLWFLDQLNPGSDAYNMPVALRLRGQLDCERLQRAFDRVLARHEALRTTFAFSEDSLVQKIAPEAEVRIETVDLSGVGSEGRDQTLNAMIQATASKSFDLAFGPLIRAVLFRLEPEEHVLLFCMHHTVSDGWSLAILFKELEAFYIANAAPEQEAGLPSLPVQYADYARWQRERMTGRALESELNYWRDSMRGAPSEIRFPSARRSSEKVERLTIDFPEAFVKLLGQKAQESGTTPFGMLMAALNLALARWTGQTDLVIGTVVAGRNRREFEHLIGCFMNFLPIRTQVRMDATGAEFVKDMRNRLLQAQTHQDCPFEKIVEALNPARKGDSNPLYNVAFLWQNFPHDLFEAEGLKSSTVPVAPSAALLDLRFEAEQEGNKLSLMCEFRSGMFRAEAIQALLESLLATAETLICEPDKRVETIKIDDRLIGAPAELETQKPAEGKLAICGTFTAEPVAESVQYWLNELGLTLGVEFAPYSQVFQELLTPESLLGQNNTGCNVSLIRLEDWLGEKKSRREDYGPALERNASEFISALRALAARNPAPHIVCVCPPSRKAASDPALRELFIAKEELLRKEVSALPGVHLLTAGEIMTWYPVQNYDDPAAEELGHVPYTPMFYTALGTALVRKLHAIKRAPAKVIVLDCDHTIWSGVCGEDGCNCIKVEGPWKALQEFMRAQRDSGMLLALCSKNNPEDVEEVFARRKDMPLLREHFAAVRLNWRPKSENLRSMAAELNLGLDSFVFLDDNPVECAEVEANCPEVLTLQLPEDPATIPAFLQHCWIFDHAKITSEDRKRAEMYRQNSERERLRSQSSGLADFIASLDLKVQIAPMEESSVERVAQLTQRTNQFNMTTRRRTEPEVRTLPAGTKVLTVKVADRFGDYGLVGVLIYTAHGESLDIDTFLLSCRVLGRGVEHKMLSRIGEIAREQRLRWVDLHYAATAKNKPALNFLESTAGSFKQHVNVGLLFRLPAGFASEVTFNVQSQASPHEAMQDAAPQPKSDSTPRFKACRTIAMRGGDIARVHRRIENRNQQTGETREVAALPETELERTLAGMWSRLLRRDDIGATDNFFDLGGHSLLAVRLFAEIERATGRKLPLVTLFQAPTVRELATVLQRERQHKPAGVEALLVPIQPQGDLPPLFLVHGAGGDVLWGYANLAGHLGNDRPIYGIKSRGQIGLEECSTIPEMAACYVQALRSRQPHGPYYLGGYCFGGNVAYEMARVLRAAGEEVAMIALLDSSPSNAGYEEVNWKSLQFICRFLRNSMFWLQDFAQQPFKDQVRFVSRKGHVVGRKLRDKLSGRTLPKVDLEEVIDPVNFPEHELKLWQTHLQALVDHVEQTYDGSVKLFRTRGQPVLCSFADDFCWGKVVRGGVEIIRIPGSHENIFMEPNVEVLASELAKALRVPQSAQMVKEEAFV